MFDRFQVAQHLNDAVDHARRESVPTPVGRRAGFRTARAWAERGRRSWLEPMKRAARMFRNHLFGIVDATIFPASNALSETINGKIQRIKRLARGFRNPTHFKNAIVFRFGGLDLHPSRRRLTHTDS